MWVPSQSDSAVFSPPIDVFYDCTHYALHHTKLPAYLREVKKYHLAHHYKNYELGFGVTSTSSTDMLVCSVPNSLFDHRQTLGSHLQHRPSRLDTRFISVTLHFSEFCNTWPNSHRFRGETMLHDELRSMSDLFILRWGFPAT